MTKNFIKNTFSFFFDKEIFAAIIACFIIIGLISWANVNQSIKNDVHHRLEYEAEFIASSFTDSLKSYAFSLAFTRSYFDTNGIPSSTQFKKFVESLQTQSPIKNLIDLDFADKAKLNKLTHKLPKNHHDDIFKTFHNSSIAMTYSLTNDTSWTLALPYFSQLNTAAGLLHIPIHMNKIFDHILGESNLNKEHTNFTLSYLDPESKKQTVIYTRFPNQRINSDLMTTKEIEVYGKNWIISIYALPDFLSFSDRYLGHIVAFATALVIVLLFSFFKQFENAMVHEAKEKSLLKESSRMKTVFLANMSHEIRTPLNAITGYSEILAKTDKPHDRRILIDSIQKNSSHLTSIIDNILDISNIEFGKILINTHHIPLKNIFDDILINMNSRANAKRIEFRISAEDSLPEKIQTAESRLKQILINLLGNAIKFTEAGSVTLSITTEKNSIGVWFLMVTVTDTGIGISKHDQDDLFKCFSQADDSSTRKFGGIGLGLAVSKRMAQQFGGDIDLIDSRLGCGSTFQLRIPCGDLQNIVWKKDLFKDIAQPKTPTYVHNYSQLVGMKILIVEDAVDNQDIFQFFLQSVGAITEVVDNGISAIRRARENVYDLILMDIQLPQMDGLEATRRLRNEGFTNPIIALTAHASPEEKASSLNSGCVGLITKPVSQNTLIQQILTIMSDSSKDVPVRKIALTGKEIYDRNYASSR